MFIGHKKQWEILKKSAESGNLPHALLFAGQSHLGKRTLAIELAKLINCSAPKNGNPCCQCRNCIDIEKNQHPDVVIVSPQKSVIDVAQIRDLGHKFSLKSYSSKTKVAIIDCCETMNTTAQNSFLKILEEPKGDTLFILVAEFPDLLLPTITSRVQKIKFYCVPGDEISDYLASKKVPKITAGKIMSVSAGRPGVAEDLLRNPEKLAEQEKIISDLMRLARSPLAKRFEYAKEIAKDSSLDSPEGEETDKNAKVRKTLDIWLRYAKSSLARQAQAFGGKDAEWQKLRKTKKIIKTIQRLDYLLSSTNVNPKLSLEILMLEL